MRFTLREFPFDPLATAAFMLARCAGPDKREAMVDLLFAQQQNWAFTDKPLEGLSHLVKQTGMSQQAFEACLKDKALYDKVNADARPRCQGVQGGFHADFLHQRPQAGRRHDGVAARKGHRAASEELIALPVPLRTGKRAVGA